jgi:hypothetical protein
MSIDLLNEHIISFTILLSSYTEQIVDKTNFIMNIVIIILKILLLVLSFIRIENEHNIFNHQTISNLISMFLFLYSFGANMWNESENNIKSNTLSISFLCIILIIFVYIWGERFIKRFIKYIKNDSTEILKEKDSNIETYILSILLIASAINELFIVYKIDRLILTFVRLICTIIFVNYLYKNNRFNFSKEYIDENATVLILTILSYIMSIINITIKKVIENEEKERHIINISNLSFTILFVIIVLYFLNCLYKRK